MSICFLQRIYTSLDDWGIREQRHELWSIELQLVWAEPWNISSSEQRNHSLLQVLGKQTTWYNIRWLLRIKAITMEPSSSLDDILQHMDPSLLQGYKKFMHEVIIRASVITILLWKQWTVIYWTWTSIFLTMRCMCHQRSSPLGFEHVRAMTSMVFYKTHVDSTHQPILRWLSLSSLVAPMVWI